jgi:hypothetical protein
MHPWTSRPSYFRLKFLHLPFLIWGCVAVPALRHGFRSVPIPALRPIWMRDLRLYRAREAGSPALRRRYPIACHAQLGVACFRVPSGVQWTLPASGSTPALSGPHRPTSRHSPTLHWPGIRVHFGAQWTPSSDFPPLSNFAFEPLGSRLLRASPPDNTFMGRKRKRSETCWYLIHPHVYQSKYSTTCNCVFYQ